MTLKEIIKVENAIFLAYSSAKFTYETSLKDYGEDHFLTTSSKEDFEHLSEAKEIIENERREISKKYTVEEFNRILSEVEI